MTCLQLYFYLFIIRHTYQHLFQLPMTSLVNMEIYCTLLLNILDFLTTRFRLVDIVERFNIRKQFWRLLKQLGTYKCHYDSSNSQCEKFNLPTGRVSVN